MISAATGLWLLALAAVWPLADLTDLPAGLLRLVTTVRPFADLADLPAGLLRLVAAVRPFADLTDLPAGLLRLVAALGPFPDLADLPAGLLRLVAALGPFPDLADLLAGLPRLVAALGPITDLADLLAGLRRLVAALGPLANLADLLAGLPRLVAALGPLANLADLLAGLPRLVAALGPLANLADLLAGLRRLVGSDAAFAIPALLRSTCAGTTPVAIAWLLALVAAGLIGDTASVAAAARIARFANAAAVDLHLVETRVADFATRPGTPLGAATLAPRFDVVAPALVGRDFTLADRTPAAPTLQRWGCVRREGTNIATDAQTSFNDLPTWRHLADGEPFRTGWAHAGLFGYAVALAITDVAFFANALSAGPDLVSVADGRFGAVSDVVTAPSGPDRVAVLLVSGDFVRTDRLPAAPAWKRSSRFSAPHRSASTEARLYGVTLAPVGDGLPSVDRFPTGPTNGYRRRGRRRRLDPDA